MHQIRKQLSRREFLTGLFAGGAVLTQPGFGVAAQTRGPLAVDPALLSLREAAKAIRTKALSPVELTQACLARIDRFDRRLNAFICVTAEIALADARRAEREVMAGHWRGPLHGVPIGLKDNIDTAGVRTTAASAVFLDRVPAADALLVRHLKAAGAVFLGKQNMHEFALGTTSAISHFDAVHNPWNSERSAGGSSGGSAAAVAASLCFGSVGTDTGGSIRIPAACCGIVGFKPGYGIVSTEGVVPVSTAFDHAGPICRSVADAALMFRAMTSHPVAQACDPARFMSPNRLRVGVFHDPSRLCDAAVDAETLAAVDAAIGVIRRLVAEVRETQLPMPESLGRLIDFDSYSYHRAYLAQTPERYDPRTRAILEDGRSITAAEAAQLRHELTAHRARIGSAFSNVNLVLLPTLPSPAMSLRDASDPFALPACTFAFSLGGLPSISVPCGFSRSGLPIGLLISGPPLSEPRLLALAQAYEQSTEWHRFRPPL